MAEHDSIEIVETVSFGPFRLEPARQILWEGDKRLPLGSRAMDILIALVERAGELVSKDDLISRVWPNTLVEEANLRVHIANLRRALRDGQSGSRYIETDPGRGYRFVAPIELSQPTTATDRVAAAPVIINLPGTLTNVIGREAIVAALSSQLRQQRFVTLIGPGGIGKTTVAVAVAQELAASYRDGVAFLDLAPVADASLLPSVLATVLDLPIPADDRLPGLLAHLKGRRMLLVLDSCEHLAAAAAVMAEAVFAAAPGIDILATSREPLRASGEHVRRLPPLEHPAASDISAAEALRFPGVRLFVERTAATNLDGFELSDSDAPVVSEICRRLDGIALAIELAAGCVNTFGVRELAARLDDRFRLLTSGRRTALPRHQTLAATLDWSYQLLSEEERRLLQQLAVFAGEFSLESALAVAGGDQASRLMLLANLVGKSLVTSVRRGNGAVARYRLLDSTRLYALNKLRDGGEFTEASRRHAGYYRELFARAEGESETRPPAEWRGVYANHIDNVRVALNWAFSAEGDAPLGVALTIVAVPLWVHLSLLGECRTWAERALAQLDGTGQGGSQARMQLMAALGWSLMFAVGAARSIREAWATTHELAEQLDDTGYRLKALWGLWVDRLNHGQLNTAAEFAHKFAAIVAGSSDVVDLMMADRILATTLHFMGDQTPARHHIDRMLGRYAAVAGQQLGARFQFDQQVTAHYFQARILWLLGFADQAMHIVEHNIEEARPIGNALSLGSVLGQGACPIALLSGDLDAAERYGVMLLDHANSHALRNWATWARCFNGIVAVKGGQIDAGIHSLQAEFERAGETLLLPRYLFLLGELSLCLGEAGEVSKGLQTVEGAIARCEASGERWYLPELWRIKGEVIARGGSGDAEECFRRSLTLAREQNARSWELRAAISLARLRRDAAARDDLSKVYGEFTEGFATGDLRAARRLLAELA